MLSVEVKVEPSMGSMWKGYEWARAYRIGQKWHSGLEQLVLVPV